MPAGLRNPEEYKRTKVDSYSNIRVNTGGPTWATRGTPDYADVTKYYKD